MGYLGYKDDDVEEEDRYDSDRTSCTFGDLPAPGPASHPPSASPGAGISGTWQGGDSDQINEREIKDCMANIMEDICLWSKENTSKLR